MWFLLFWPPFQSLCSTDPERIYWLLQDCPWTNIYLYIYTKYLVTWHIWEQFSPPLLARGPPRCWSPGPWSPPASWCRWWPGSGGTRSSSASCCSTLGICRSGQDSEVEEISKWRVHIISHSSPCRVCQSSRWHGRSPPSPRRRSRSWGRCCWWWSPGSCPPRSSGNKTGSWYTQGLLWKTLL